MTAFARMHTCRDCMAPVEPHVLRCDYHAEEQQRALEAAGFDHRRSLSDALALCGYTHRANAQTITTQRRDIIDADGAVVTTLTAHEAWEWIAGGRLARLEAEAGR